jgi:MFS family permease
MVKGFRHDPRMPAPAAPRRAVVVACLGVTQILSWASSFHLPAVVAAPIAAETNWPLASVIGGLSLGLVVAALVSPGVGRAIETHGGRPVLALGSGVLAAGLVALAFAASLPVYFAAWAVIGAGMGMSLYDPAFATLGRLYGDAARGPIRGLTLVGGFASTVGWSLSAFCLAHVGWRGTCLAYAGLHLAVSLPIHLLVLPAATPLRIAPSRPAGDDPGRRPGHGPPATPQPARRPLLVGLLALSLTTHAAVWSVVSVSLLLILQRLGLDLAGAVALAALVGPAQVGGRLVDTAFGRRLDPVWTALIAAALVTAGLGLLGLGGSGLAGLALLIYGAGNGVQLIAKGSLPLALFGPVGYAALVGRLARPALLAQALAPPGAALLLGNGVAPVLWLVAALAALNIGAILVLAFEAGRLRAERRSVFRRTGSPGRDSSR